VVIPAVGMAVRDQDRALAFYIAELVAFLMSDAGACINGQVLYVDGGTILS
jgi:enoyl-[acyl-carrier-protein] reductase (NADH)